MKVFIQKMVDKVKSGIKNKLPGGLGDQLGGLF